MLRHIMTIARRKPFIYISMNRKLIPVYIKMLRLFPRQQSELLKMHSYSNYTAIVNTLKNSIHAKSIQSYINALWTSRFIVITEPIYIDSSKLPTGITRNAKEIAMAFICSIETLLDEVEGKDLENDVKKLYNMLNNPTSPHILASLLSSNKNILASFIEEYIHSRIFRKTTMWLLEEVLAWKERLLEMYIVEKIHRHAKRLPRFPEIEFGQEISGKDPSQLETIKRFLSETRKEIVNAVDDGVLKAFKELIATIFFMRYLYPKLMLPFIEVPTWIIMMKIGIVDEKIIEKRMEEGGPYFQDEKDAENAQRIYDELKGKNINEIERIVRTVLSPPLNDLIKKINDAINTKEISIVEDYFMDRFNNVLSNTSSSKPYQVRISFLDIVKMLNIIDINDLAEVIIDVVLKDRELFESFYLKKVAKEYGHVGVVLSLKIMTNGTTYSIPMIFVDKWSGSCKESKVEIKESHTTQMKGGTVEYLVGSIPRAMRSYIILRDLIMGMGLDKALEVFLGSLPGKPMDLFERARICMEKAEDFEYKGLEGYDNANAEDLANIIMGTAFMLACIGDFGYGVHGIHF